VINLAPKFLKNFIELSVFELRQGRDGFIVFFLEKSYLLDETINFIISKLEAERAAGVKRVVT